MNYEDRVDNPMADNAVLDAYYANAANAAYIPERGKRVKNREGAYASTERRLYALPILRERIEDNREELAELENCGLDALRKHSASLVRVLRPGIRLTAEEVHQAQMAELRGRLAADEREVRKLQTALALIADDPYYLTVELRYFKGEHDTAIAKRLCCDPATVRRNRSRLVKRLALRLYGAEALEI